MNEANLNYSSYMFGTFTLAEDKIEWVDHDHKTGAIAYADVHSVQLAQAATGGSSGMGQASLVNDIGGTTATTISGISGAGTDSTGSDAWEMKLKSDLDTLNISMNPDLDDDAAFLSFIKALHKKIAAANASAKFSIAGSMNLIAVVFISVVLLMLAAGAAFFGNAVGFPILIGIGVLLAIGAVALLLVGMKKSKPKAYDPLNIPDDAFSS